MRRLSALALALLLVAVVPAGAAKRPSQPAQPPSAETQSQPVQEVVATCTFSNPGFSGKCVERVNVPPGWTPAKACGGILACLNSTMCTKTYCSSTTIRTGWALESAAVPKR